MIPNTRFYIGFDPRDKKQTEEAKKQYQEARLAGRAILNPENFSEEILSWSSIKDGFTVESEQLIDAFTLRILDQTGDRRVIWNLKSPLETKEAQELFDEYIKKDWRAYAIDRRGKKSHRIMSFDHNLQEVIFEDKTIKEKMKDFAKKVSEVRMVPKTYPG